jgi:hypothetical protein
MQSPFGGSLELIVLCDSPKKTIAAVAVRPLERVEVCPLRGVEVEILIGAVTFCFWFPLDTNHWRWRGTSPSAGSRFRLVRNSSARWRSANWRKKLWKFLQTGNRKIRSPEAIRIDGKINVHHAAKFLNYRFKIGGVMIFRKFQVRKFLQTGNRKIRSPDWIRNDKKIILYHLAKVPDDPMYGCRVIGRGAFSRSPQSGSYRT